MNYTQIVDALGKKVQLTHASRLHELPRTLAMGKQAEQHLAHALAQETQGRRATLIFDSRTREIAGDRCEKALKYNGFHVSTCLVPDPKGASPVCDDHTKNGLLHRLPSSDVLVAIGSGVINDLTKWLASETALPYGVFATAASMNGYSSANVAAKLKGVKSLVRAHAPKVVATDPDVLEKAPYPLTVSGFGDLLAKPMSTTDWLVNHTLFDESYCPELVSLMEGFEYDIFTRPQALVSGETIPALFEALLISGCTMTLYGSSLPASGAEHVISHTLDMMTEADNVPHDLHGRQVGIGTVISAALWQKMMALEAPDFVAAMPAWNPKVWGPAADAVQVQRQAKKILLEHACEKLSSTWDELRTTVAPYLCSPDTIQQRLQKARGAWKLDHIGCSRDRFLTAIHHAPAMRTRLTTLDLARMTGILPRQTEAIIDTWVV